MLLSAVVQKLEMVEYIL